MGLAYDGTGFRGFALQPDQRTVEGVLAAAIEKVVGRRVALAVAGRTDTGVHASGQVVSFEAPITLDPARLTVSLNSMLGPEVVVRDARLMPNDFHARYSARWRKYRYTILNCAVPDPFIARTSWHISAPLDLDALHLASDPFVGEHDFASFSRKLGDGKSTVRRVFESRWADLGDGVLRYEIRANAFCQQMVRSIVGTLVEVGTGKQRPGDILGMLCARDRSVVGSPAPPHGLCLWEVGYDDVES